jgi:integrase
MVQTRPYPDKNGVRVWLARSESEQLLEAVEDAPRERIAFQLGLHGLRSDEIVNVTPDHFRDLVDGDGSVLLVPDGKTGMRELPVSDDLVERVSYLSSAARLNQTDPIVDVSTRSVRRWIERERDDLAEELGEPVRELGLHDLRRTWATSTYYELAVEGVPIAEQLVMSWGGWSQTQTGRETFRENYLGPVPDSVTSSALPDLSLP